MHLLASWCPFRERCPCTTSQRLSLSDNRRLHRFTPFYTLGRPAVPLRTRIFYSGCDHRGRPFIQDLDFCKSWRKSVSRGRKVFLEHRGTPFDTSDQESADRLLRPVWDGFCPKFSQFWPLLAVLASPRAVLPLRKRLKPVPEQPESKGKTRVSRRQQN